MALRTKVKYGLSAAMLALIAAGASAPQLLDQFLQEREGNMLVAVRDNGGVWSVCRGVTRIDGKPVVKGQRLTQSQCDHYNAIERDKALAWVNKNIHVPLTGPQKVGIASFCPYNIGPGKCLPSTFYRKLNAGDRKERVQKSAVGYMTAAKTATTGKISVTAGDTTRPGIGAGVLGY